MVRFGRAYPMQIRQYLLKQLLAAFDAVGVGASTGAATMSWTDTVPADCNLAIMWVGSVNTTSTPTASASIGGVSMTAVPGGSMDYTTSGSSNYFIRAFYLFNPPTGSQTVSTTSSSWTNSGGDAIYFKNVASIGTPITNSGASGASSLSVSSSDQSAVYTQAFAYRPNAVGDTFSAYNQNQRYVMATPSTGVPMLIGDAQGNGGTLPFTVTKTNTSWGWGAMAIPLLSTAAAFDAVGIGANSAATDTWTDTVPGDCNLAVVWFSYAVSSGTPTISATLGGQTMTQVPGAPLTYASNISGFWFALTAFYLFDPPTGSQSVSVTTTAFSSSTANAQYFKNASTVGTAVTNSGASGTASQSVSSSLSYAVYAQCFTYRANATGNTFTAYNQTQDFLLARTASSMPTLIGHAQGNGGTLSFTTTKSDNTFQWGAMAIPIS